MGKAVIGIILVLSGVITCMGSLYFGIQAREGGYAAGGCFVGIVMIGAGCGASGSAEKKSNEK